MNDHKNNPTFLVTGSEGATGSYLIDSLSTNYPNSKLVRVTRSDKNLKSNSRNHKIYNGDLLDREFCKKIFSENHIDIIIFSAALWNGLNEDQFIYDSNITLFRNLLQSINKNLKHIIFFSSSAVYNSGNYSDSQSILLDPKSTYGKSKLESEILLHEKALENNFNYTIYRPFHIMSPMEKYNQGTSHITTDFTYRYVEKKIDFDWNNLDDSPKIPLSWVGDISQLIVSNISNKNLKNETFNIGSKYLFSVHDLALSIAIAANKLGLSSHSSYIKRTFNGKLENNFFNKLNQVLEYPEFDNLPNMVEMYLKIKYGDKNEDNRF